MKQHRQEYATLRRAYEFRHEHRHLLETIVGQHAIIMTDLIVGNAIVQQQQNALARLEANRKKWEFSIFYYLGQESVVTREHDPLRLESRFQRTVETMLRTFTGGIVEAVLRGQPFDACSSGDFYAVLSTRASYSAAQTCAKIGAYVYYLMQLALAVRQGHTDDDVFYTLASSCIVAGSNLGLWLDMLL